MTTITEDFEAVPIGTTVSASNTAYDDVQKSTGAIFRGDNLQAYLGTRAGYISITTATDFAYARRIGMNTTHARLRVAVRFDELPNIAAGQSCKFLTFRAGTDNVAYWRYISGNRFELLNAADASLQITPAFSADAWWLFELAADIGTTTSNGRIRGKVWNEDGATIAPGVDVVTNTGIANITEKHVGKHDAQGLFKGWIDYDLSDDASSTLYGYPVTATAVAKAGLDTVLDPLANRLPGDGAVARAQLDGKQSIVSGGTPVYTWSAPVGSGITFTDVHDPEAQAIIPQLMTPATYDITLGLVVGSASSSDVVAITVRGAEHAKARGGQWVPVDRGFFR